MQRTTAKLIALVLGLVLMVDEVAHATVTIVEDGADLEEERILTTENVNTTDSANRMSSSKPNILVIMSDDFGWANLGYHRAVPTNEVQTPNMDALAGDGVKLERFYTFHMCSPSRCAFQTGRYAQHVNSVNTDPEVLNRADKEAGYSGIPISMSTIANKMQDIGYRTVAVGKWDVGMATPRHIPKGRGYSRSLVYFHHAIGYFDCGVSVAAIGAINICLNQFTDLWLNDGPATGMCKGYVEDVFADYAVAQIKSAARSNVPLFMFYSSHLVHSPLEAPSDVLNMFSFIDDIQRQRVAAMAYYLDLTVGKLVKGLKDSRIYDNTLIIFFSDNGGAIYYGGGGNNYPLRAGKYADFDGGVRVNAFVSGGLIPAPNRGTSSEVLVHIADLYASIIRIGLFGTSSDVNRAKLYAHMFDAKAYKAGLAQPDSMDTLWGAITKDPRETRRFEIWLSSNSIMWNNLKLITGSVPQDMWQGPFYPNKTGPQPTPAATDNINPGGFTSNCGTRGCLFDVFLDPTEHNDIAANHPGTINLMLARLAELNQTIFSPVRGNETFQACVAAKKLYGGYYGPFVLPKPLNG